LPDFVGALTLSESFLREVGEVFLGNFTVNQETFLTVLLDVIKFSQLIIYFVNILFSELDLDVTGIVVDIGQISLR